jgi:hypothetical protein
MLRFLSDWIGCFLALGQEIVYSWGTFVCLPLLLRGVRLIQIVWYYPPYEIQKSFRIQYTCLIGLGVAFWYRGSLWWCRSSLCVGRLFQRVVCRGGSSLQRRMCVSSNAHLSATQPTNREAPSSLATKFWVAVTQMLPMHVTAQPVDTANTPDLLHSCQQLA